MAGLLATDATGPAHGQVSCARQGGRMFILYGLLAGLAAGLFSGGGPGGLTELRLRWVPVVLAGLLVQVVLFWGPVSDRVGTLGPVLYVGSTALVFAAVLRNVRLPGLPIVAAGEGRRSPTPPTRCPQRPWSKSSALHWSGWESPPPPGSLAPTW